MNFSEIKSSCIKCERCSLSKTRINVVFGDGADTAQILFIGEAPGKNEDEVALPFVGRSGKLLDAMLAEAGLYRDKNIYISNTVKCRPPENRDPSTDEKSACIDWLRLQIDTLKPEIIVCLGRVAAQSIIDPKIKITKEHGCFTLRDGIYYVSTFHPAAILRNPNNKPLLLNDFNTIYNKGIELGIL